MWIFLSMYVRVWIKLIINVFIITATTLLCTVFAGLLYVDASQKANLGSSCSHSCNANCTSSIVSRNGKLAIALTTVCKLTVKKCSRNLEMFRDAKYYYVVAIITTYFIIIIALKLLIYIICIYIYFN